MQVQDTTPFAEYDYPGVHPPRTPDDLALFVSDAFRQGWRPPEISHAVLGALFRSGAQLSRAAGRTYLHMNGERWQVGGRELRRFLIGLLDVEAGGIGGRLVETVESQLVYAAVTYCTPAAQAAEADAAELAQATREALTVGKGAR